MRALLQSGGGPAALPQAPSNVTIVSLLPTNGLDNYTTPIVANTGGSRGGGGFSLGPVAYISGICLLVSVAVCLLLIACALRRKDRRHAAALVAAQEAQLAAAAATAAQEAAYRAAHPPTIPVVIVNPDGKFELAEKVELSSGTPKGSPAEPDLSSGGGGGGKGGEPPIGFHTSHL